MLTIYLDLDGVLVDFVRGVFARHGKSLPMNEVRWGLEEQLGIHPDVFWAACDRDFWAHLPPTEEGGPLLAGIERLFGESVALMTSACDTNGSVAGKVDWIAKHLPAYKKRFFIGAAKHLAAGPGKILVDDHEVNVNRFEEHGGKTVLVPRPWNRRRDETDGAGRFSVATVLKELRDLRDGSL